MDPINAPYAMEKRSTALNPLTLSLSSEVYRIKVIPMGSIIAATVCSPIKEDKIPEIAVNPKTIFFVETQSKTLVQNQLDRFMATGYPANIVQSLNFDDRLILATFGTFSLHGLSFFGKTIHPNRFFF